MVSACGRVATGPGAASDARTSSPAPVALTSPSAPSSCQGPTWRNYSALNYDAARQQLVLFGGWGADIYGDTWLRSGSCWQLVSATSTPSPRWSPAGSFDPNHQQVVLYGGRTAPNTWLDDTWIWDGRNWTNVQVTPHPIVSFPMGAYDPIIRKFAVYGFTANGESQTWTWDGNAWQQIVTSLAPPARFSSALAFDAVSGTVILFGGRQTLGFVGDTWAFDGINWKQLTPSKSPSARAGHLMASVSQGVLLLGNDTWLWDGSTWQAITAAHPLPVSVAGAGMTSQDGAALLVLYRTRDASPEEFLFAKGDWIAM